MTAAYTGGMMTQDAVYWPPASRDGFGKRAWGAPVAVKCRWQSGGRLVRNAQGDMVMSSAVVYVDTEMVTGGMLSLGSDTADAPISTSREIIQVGASPSLDGTQQLNKVWL